VTSATAKTAINTLELESAYYALAIRCSTVASLVICLGAFLFLPKEIEVKAYQLRRSIETVMEALPPQLEKMADEPQQVRPQAAPVAAQANEADVQETIESTTFTEVTKRATDTDIPVVPFWKVEVKPQQISVPKPDYPEMARSAGIEGTTVVEALVDIDGTVADARVLKTSNNQTLDAAAVEAARRATFRPAMQRDNPVRVWVSIPYRFSLQ
jgi:protein TonB